MKEKNPLKNFIYFYNLVCSKRQTESKRKQSIHLEQHILTFFSSQVTYSQGTAVNSAALLGVITRSFVFFFNRVDK